jgi:hypothetical protein
MILYSLLHGESPSDFNEEENVFFMGASRNTWVIDPIYPVLSEGEACYPRFSDKKADG